MKIDRTRFLLLSTSLAAATAAAVLSTTGCQNTTTDTDAGTTAENDSGTTPTSDSGATSDDAGDAAAACLGNDPAKGPYCGPSGEGGDPDAGEADAGPAPKCPAGCSSFSNYFKSEVAKGLNDCLEAAPTCEGLESSCVDKVLAQACTDQGAVDFCTGLAATCGDAGAGDSDGGTAFSQESCLKVANGLSDNGKTFVTSCIEGLPDNCGYCLDSVKNQAF